VAAGGFAERLAYVRWVRSMGRLKPETDAELARAMGVGDKWLAKWKTSARPPEGRSEAAAIEASGVVSVDWLYDARGEAPRPELWRDWIDERRAFGDGSESPIPTLERESFEEEEPTTRATGTVGRPNAKKRR
jgi:transcriptional regulator with XRE-family HTH domain